MPALTCSQQCSMKSFWSRMLRGCIPDSVSLRFEFSFYEWRKFRADTRIILVAYAAWLHSGFGFATFRI